MKIGTLLGVCAAVAAAFGLAPAQALTMQECSAKYNAAKTAGSLNGQKWSDFRKAECGSDAAATTPATATKSEAKAPAEKSSSAPKAATAAPMPAGDAKFPTAVDTKYSKETAGKARMHTCVDQYNANKASNANGGMKWIQKGGGYYSECTKRLEGSA